MKYSEKQKRIINDILDDSKTKRKRIKGLEMENVILVLNENRRGRMTKETIKEEVYVGLTRATRKLIILDGLAYDYLRSIYM